jgi:hypothetical protein
VPGQYARRTICSPQRADGASYLRVLVEKDQGVSFCTRRLRIVAGGEFLKHEEASSVCTYGERKKERKKEGKKE